MIIKIHGENFKAEPNFTVIGYMGEHNARTIDITQPTVEGAESYVLRFEYPDSIIYDVPIEDGKVTVTASLLRVADDVRCQWIAAKPNSEGSYDIVAKSQIFTLTIKSSIGDDVAPIPTYEQAQSMLDQLNEGIDSKITEPEQDGTSGQVLATDGNGNRYWRTVQGGGGSGENGATFTPSVSPEGVISWTNDKDLPNPEPVNIKGPQGERGLQGERGEKGEKGDTGEQGIQGLQGEKGEKGDTGEQGIQGIQGERGSDGYTPVRGTDYWTAEDIAAINTHNDSYVDGKFAEAEQDISNSVQRAEQAASSASQSATNAENTKAEVEAIVYEDVIGSDLLASVEMNARTTAVTDEQENTPFSTENYSYKDETETNPYYSLSDIVELPNGKYRLIADSRCDLYIDIYNPYYGCYSYEDCDSVSISQDDWTKADGKYICDIEITTSYSHNYARAEIRGSVEDWQSYGVELRPITRGSKIIADVHDYIQEHKEEFKGEKGADGQDYVLTENDKSEIADIAIGNLADGDERRYPQ